MFSKNMFFVLPLVLLSLIGCSEVETGDGYIRPGRKAVLSGGFSTVEKADVSVDTVVSNNRYLIQTTLKKTGSSVGLIAHANDSMEQGARILIQRSDDTTIKVYYGLQGQGMKVLPNTVADAGAPFRFVISVYNEQDEVGVEVEANGEEVLHAHIEEGRGQGKAFGVEFSNDGTQIEDFGVQFNIPEHAHGAAEDEGTVASVPQAHVQEVVYEKLEKELPGPRGDTGYTFKLSLPENGSYAGLITNATAERKGGVTVLLKRLDERKLEITYGLNETLKKKVIPLDDTKVLNIELAVYNEADEVAIDMEETTTHTLLLHTHLHGFAIGKNIHTVKKQAEIQNLVIDTEIPGHGH